MVISLCYNIGAGSSRSSEHRLAVFLRVRGHHGGDIVTTLARFELCEGYSSPESVSI